MILNVDRCHQQWLCLVCRYNTYNYKYCRWRLGVKAASPFLQESAGGWRKDEAGPQVAVSALILWLLEGCPAHKITEPLVPKDSRPEQVEEEIRGGTGWPRFTWKTTNKIVMVVVCMSVVTVSLSCDFLFVDQCIQCCSFQAIGLWQFKIAVWQAWAHKNDRCWEVVGGLDDVSCSFDGSLECDRQTDRIIIACTLCCVAKPAVRQPDL